MHEPRRGYFLLPHGLRGHQEKNPRRGGWPRGALPDVGGGARSATHKGVALLVLLAGTARTRIVAPDLHAVDGAPLAPCRRAARADVRGGAVALLPVRRGCGR